jgi:predicted AAA+ superfamily ATPase
MILKSSLDQILASQKENLLGKEYGLKREAVLELPDLSAFALIISGIRRCGKSTLLNQMLKERFPDALYLNFEDPRLYEFERNDFNRLDEIILEKGSKVLLFDEIQIIPDWERYARQKIDEKFKVVITGSNASLLKSELGTKLTGRHITKELFPFSYREFNLFHQSAPSPDSLHQYLQSGGFPEYVKQNNEDILNHVFDDILIRDIAIRYGIRDIKTLQRLALYLISNVGKLFTANRIKSLFEVGSTVTITDYLSHLEDSYLFCYVQKFSHSVRKQMINPRKVYAIDTGLISANSSSYADDNGRRLENLVFLHLRRKTKDIYYYSEKGECDFVTFNKGSIQEVIQVCHDLNPDNLNRELNGIFEALEFFGVKEGKIITFQQKDHFEKDGRKVEVLECHELLQ